MNILINALGIQDSGGITVLMKALDDCSTNNSNSYIVVCNDNRNINSLKEKYTTIKFLTIPLRGFLHRMYYENIVFMQFVKRYNIKLIYNFSGTAQMFLKLPQLIKIQNLLFYSKKLDALYREKGKFMLWLKQIYLKRVIFAFMANHSRYLEIQSLHVKKYMGATPPDLSIIIRAKSKEYLETFIDNPQKLLKNTSMPRVGLTKESTEKVISYLESVGDSKKAERESLIPKVIGYLIIFTLFAYLWKSKLWREVH